MNLAEVLGLNDRAIQQKKLAEKSKIREIIQVLLTHKSEVLKIDPKAWEGFAGRISTVAKDLDSPEPKWSLKNLIVMLRQVASDINDLSTGNKIAFDDQDRLSKESLTALTAIEDRRDKLLEKLGGYKKLAEELTSIGDTDTRLGELRSLIESISLNALNATTLDDILLCEQDAKQIWNFTIKSSDFDPKLLAEQISKELEKLGVKSQRSQYSHRLDVDTTQVESHLQTIQDDTATEFDRRMAFKLGMQLCNSIDSQILAPNHLKLPKIDAVTLELKLQAISGVLENLQKLSESIKQAFSGSPVEEQEADLLIVPRIEPLITSAQASLEEVQTAIQAGLAETKKLTAQTKPLDERIANSACIRLAIGITNAQNSIASNTLLQKWHECTFFDGQPNLADTLADIF